MLKPRPLKEKRKKMEQAKKIIQQLKENYEPTVDSIFATETAGLDDADKQALQGLKEKIL